MSIDIPIVVSIVSFVISVYTLWTTRLAKFSLSVVSTARVELTANPQSLGAKQPGIMMQLLFTNRGANLGYVHDVAVVLRKVDSPSTPVMFRSLFENLEDTLNLTEQLPPPKLVAFTSFPIRPSETIIKKILFVPFKPEPELKYEKGKYLFIPYTRDVARGHKWKKWDTIEIDIDEGDLSVLGKTVATPTAGGGQFVKWMIHSKPTSDAESALNNLATQIGNKK